MMHTMVHAPTSKRDQRPYKIKEYETGKTVATSTTSDKAVADIKRRYEKK